MSVVWFKFDLHYFFFWLNNIFITLKNIVIFIDSKIHLHLTCSKRYETTLSWFVVYKQLSGFLWQLLQIEKASSEGSSNLPKSDNWWSADSKLIPKSHGLKSRATFYLHHTTYEVNARLYLGQTVSFLILLVLCPSSYAPSFKESA